MTSLQQLDLYTVRFIFIQYSETNRLLILYTAFNVKVRLPSSHCRVHFKWTVSPLQVSVWKLRLFCGTGGVANGRITIYCCVNIYDRSFFLVNDYTHNQYTWKPVKCSYTGNPNVCRTADTVVAYCVVSGLNFMFNPLLKYTRLLDKNGGNEWNKVNMHLQTRETTLYIKQSLYTPWRRLGGEEV
jgi:hypothetical protein